MNDYDHLFKVLMVGDSGVGKSSMLLRFVDDMFSETFISTIGVDFKIKNIQMHDKILKLQIWDTAGQERFRTITSAYYRGAHGILIVFDLTDMKSFKDVSDWKKEINRYAINNVVLLLVGNKSDVSTRRVVEYSAAKALADENGMKYIETSAKSNIAVETCFLQLAEDIFKERITNNNRIAVEKNNTVEVGQSIDQPVKSSCC